MITVEGRDRAADLAAVCRLIHRNLHTWAMPADWGVDLYEPRGYSSSSEVLGELGMRPTSDEEAEHWPPPLIAAYARELWMEAGPALRRMGERRTATLP